MTIKWHPRGAGATVHRNNLAPRGKTSSIMLGKAPSIIATRKLMVTAG